MTIKINLAPINIGSRMLQQVKNTCLSIAPECCVAGNVNSKLTPLEKDVVSIENNRQYQLPENQAVVPRELIGGEEFKTEVDTLKVFWPRTAELLTKFAKKSDEYYDKLYIDTYKIFEQYSRRDGLLILSL